MIDGVVEPLRSTTVACPPGVQGNVAYLVEDGTFVKEGDVIIVLESPDLQTYYDQLMTNLENTKAGLNKVRADLDMQYALLEAQVKTNEADTKIALMDSLQLKYSTPNQTKIKELNLERVAIEKERYEKKIQALAIIQQSEIRRQELEIQRLENNAKSTKDRLDALEIKAPKDGLAMRATSLLTGLQLQVGDLVLPPMPLVNLPNLNAMKIKIKAPETDYKQINVNDRVVYTIDAMPGNVAWGKVTMKSPVGQPMKQGSKVRFFEIEASIDSTSVMPEPGFTADCRIILQQVKDTIVIPQIAVFDQDSIKVVYVRKKNNFERRQILTGLSSSKAAIVSAGLSINEQVALLKPSDSSIKKTVLLPDSLLNKPKSDNVEIKEEKELPKGMPPVGIPGF